MRHPAHWLAVQLERDPHRLLTARELGEQLSLAPKKVYELPIPKVQLSEGRTRWMQKDVDDFVNSRRQVPQERAALALRIPANHPARNPAVAVQRTSKVNAGK